MMAIRRAVASNQIALVTRTGNPVTFSSIPGALSQCVVNILPNQSGTGDPSPQNVRPLSGYDNVTIYRTGKTGEINYPFTFESTVYGGTLNPLTGVLSIEWGIKTLGDLRWYYNATYGRFAATFPDIVETGKARNIPLYCSAFLPIYDKRSYEDTPNDSIFAGGTTAHNVYIRTADYTTEDAFKAAYGDVQIIYPLREPVTVQLTAEQITAAQGFNTVWADITGTVTVQFWGN